MPVIGIDLGTTNSACGIWKDGKVLLIPNRLGEYLTPSVVGIDDDGKITVGRVAKERLVSQSERTVGVFKRLMGTKHQISLRPQKFTAMELSSLVLRSLKEDAEVFLQEAVNEAVISVPAYFNDTQRQATKLAGEMAGFQVRRLINEPTAAAMAFGLHQKKEGTFIILDMGGGTFDVSILEYFEGVMQVHASAGDNFLGGEDFVDSMANSVLAATHLDRASLSKDQFQKLLMQMETAKRHIDDGDQTLKLELGGRTIEWPVTASWFESVTAQLLLRVKRPIETAMNDAELRMDEIDDIILVGGATRMKIFRLAIERLLGRAPSHVVDPDLAVAMGAAIQAGLMVRDQALEDTVLTDVCPYTLGTEVVGPDGKTAGYFMPIIERNSTVPISVARTVFTIQDNQTRIRVGVYQGEHRTVDKNIFLGQLEITVPKAPAGQEPVEIRYSYDINGLLEVDVTAISTGKKASKVIEQMPGSLTPDEMRRSAQRLSSLKFHPRDQEENRSLLAHGERIYESSLGARRDAIAQVLAEFDRLMDNQNPVEIKKGRMALYVKLKELDSEDWI